MKGARGRERTCQEASPLSREEFIPCGRPAVCIVDNGDEHPYRMCFGCADHNVRHRGAVRYDPSEDLLTGLKALHQAIAAVGGDIGASFPALSETWLLCGAIIARAEGRDA